MASPQEGFLPQQTIHYIIGPLLPDYFAEQQSARPKRKAHSQTVRKAKPKPAPSTALPTPLNTPESAQTQPLIVTKARQKIETRPRLYRINPFKRRFQTLIKRELELSAKRRVVPGSRELRCRCIPLHLFDLSQLPAATEGRPRELRNVSGYSLRAKLSRFIQHRTLDWSEEQRMEEVDNLL